MQVQLNPYIGFTSGNAREAMEFYQTVFGGKLELHTFKEFHSAEDPSEEDNIMHSMLEGDNGVTFMASDTPKAMQNGPTGSAISMSLSGDNEEVLRGYFDKLADGGQVFMPLEKAEWGDVFGMVTDKFGITWLVNINEK